MRRNACSCPRCRRNPTRTQRELLAEVDTGNYTVKVFREPEDSEYEEDFGYTVVIRYYGVWAGTIDIEIPFKELISYPEEELATFESAEKNAREFIRHMTDFDVERILLENGYDRYGNDLSRRR